MLKICLICNKEFPGLKKDWIGCSKKCRKIGSSGENSPRWIGGPTTYRGRGWLIERENVVKRDNGICQCCGKNVGNSIPVHHIKPFRLFETAKEANDIDNLICLCQSCHMKTENSV